jgi:capsular polysaccharide transport system permease protein
MWRNTVSRCNSAIQQNHALLYHRNVQVIDVLIARIILEMAGATVSLVALTLFFVGIQAIPSPADVSKMMEGWLMLAWFSIGLGLLVGAAASFSEFIDRIWHIVAYLLFPLSGAVFMVDWLSPGIQPYVLMLPMVHGVEMIREGYFSSVVRTHHDLAYMAACNTVLTIAGLWLVRRASYWVETR